MKKVLSALAFAMLGILAFPGIALAQEVTVRAMASVGGGEPVATVTAENGVTTGAQLKALLVEEGVVLDDYLVLDSWYLTLQDTDTICSFQNLNCYGPEQALMATIYLMPKDHTARKISLKSFQPEDETTFEAIAETNWELFDDLSSPECNEDFTLCGFKSMIDFKFYDNVQIEYVYDESIHALAQEQIDKGLLDVTEFEANDVEMLYYINYGGSLANYTSAFKNQLSNLNFRFEMDQRGGAADPFETGAIGFYKFLYGDTLYGVKSFMSITGKHIIYVPTDTEDVVAAIEERAAALFGDDVYFSVTESDDTINELLEDFGLDPIDDGDENYYILEVTNEEDFRYGMQFFFMAKKDSTKVNNTVAFKSSDLLTNVSVSAESNVPLDTLINVTHITSGETYDKIIKALDIAEGEVFDIDLYSNAQQRLVTELPNGKFLVSIPIPEKYEGKDLIVYYVDQDNNVTEHAVTVSNGYATFETDHFSTYTLAIEEKTNNPKTADSIMFYVAMFGMSAFVLTIASKKKIMNK